MQTKKNPKQFDCEQCGNQLFKSRLRDDVRCCYCGYINRIGKFKGGSKEHGKNKD